MLAANGAGVILVPELIVGARLLPQDYVGPWGLLATFHVQHKFRINGDDHEILALDIHR